MGVMLLSTGNGLTTVKMARIVAVPPPGAVLMTLTSRDPNAASGAIVMLTYICMGVVTETEFTVTPAPKAMVLTPVMKPVPLTSNPTVFPLSPVVAESVSSVGRGLFTRNPPLKVAFPPPGGRFVTVTFRGPPAVDGKIAIEAVSCVELFTVTEFVVIPEPMLTVV